MVLFNIYKEISNTTNESNLYNMLQNKSNYKKITLSLSGSTNKLLYNNISIEMDSLHDLLSNEDGIIRNLINKKKLNKLEEKKTKKTIENNDDNDSSNKKVKSKEISLKKLYNNLIHNKFKPTLNFNSTTIYSLGDAANTAIAFGLLYNLNPLLLNIFSIIFKVKKYKNDFKPVFKDKILFELTLNSIITFNLAKIIYICFIILKSFNKNRR